MIFKNKLKCKKWILKIEFWDLINEYFISLFFLNFGYIVIYIFKNNILRNCDLNMWEE